MLTRCPHCGALAWATTATARFYGGALLSWRRAICWRGHRSSAAEWE